jgi:zinc transport system ATP-binding protein
MTIGYEDQTVLSHLDFSVETGDYITILGENGSGKSTLIKTILGLTRPLSGSFSFAEGMSHKSIGYLPQQTTAQRDFPASVLEIVLSGFLGKKGWHPFYTKKEKEMALSHMEKLHIESLAGKNYRNLSGGQQQRGLLARALCAANSLLILDEPVTGLDPAAQVEFYQLIEGLNRDDHMAILMISHDISAALHYSSKILHLEDQNYFFGSLEEYKDSSLYRVWKGDN